jgi:hypothetical protein
MVIQNGDLHLLTLEELIKQEEAAPRKHQEEIRQLIIKQKNCVKKERQALPLLL